MSPNKVNVNKSGNGSRIFAPYRTLGLVSNHVPLVTHYNSRQRETFVITCVGRAFHSYKCSNFGLSWISDVHKSPISCMASDDFFLYTGCDKVITAFFHGGKVARQFMGHEAEILHLLPMISHLLSIDVQGSVRLWDIKAEELHGELTFPVDSFDVTAVCHPLTYVNKVLFGSRQGKLQLWNVRTMKQLYQFEGWNTPVTALKQSPAVDVIAVGLASGSIFLHNIRNDETLLTFSHDDGPVASITFRTDNGFSSIMLSGSQLGHIAVWNLEKRQLVGSMRHAHSSVVSGLQCIDGEPLLLSSSPDNSVKLWVFDQSDSCGRILRERSGHSAPLNSIKFHTGETARNNPDNTVLMLSAGQDGTLRSFSPLSDADNRSLGRGTFNKQQMKKAKGDKKDRYLMPPIIEIVSEAARQDEWDSIVCIHRDLPFATTWNLNKFTMGSHRFRHEDHRKAQNIGTKCDYEHNGAVSHLYSSFPSSCAITPCGNFAIIGFDSGYVDIFNIQSGIYRGSFSHQPKVTPLPPAHSDGPVRGVAIDAVSNTVVSADGSSIGCLNFWRFRSRQLIGNLHLGAPVTKIELCRENSLLAVALDDFRLLIVDIELHRVVRYLQPKHSAQITGLTFSPDGRWLFSSSMDCTIRTWDLPTSSLVDCFVTSTLHPPLGIAMSPVGDFLASIHRDQVGISLWTNRALFDFVSLHPPLDQSDVESILSKGTTDLPTTGVDDGLVNLIEEEEISKKCLEIKSLNDGLLKLSLEPETKWFSLFNLDVIREKNKPKLPPQKPVNVPFFLPTVAGLEPHLAVPSESVEVLKKKADKNLLNLPLSSWTSKLAEIDLSDENCSVELNSTFEELRNLGPSGVDLELRLIVNDESDFSHRLAKNFLRCVKEKLERNIDFDLAIAYLARFLKLFGHSLMQKPDLLEFLSREILPVVLANWNRVQSICSRSLAVISFAKAPLVL